MRAGISTAKRDGNYWDESTLPEADRPESVHESAEDSLLGVMVAVAHADSSRVAPDLGGQKQKPQTSRRQRRVLQSVEFGRFLAIEQHQLAVQVVGQHRQLEVVVCCSIVSQRARSTLVWQAF